MEVGSQGGGRGNHDLLVEGQVEAEEATNGGEDLLVGVEGQMEVKKATNESS